MTLLVQKANLMDIAYELKRKFLDTKRHFATYECNRGFVKKFK